MPRGGGTLAIDPVSSIAGSPCPPREKRRAVREQQRMDGMRRKTYG